jgi:tetratricopeptide (TPR) repeat protein
VLAYNTLSQLLVNRDIRLAKLYADSALALISLPVRTSEDDPKFYEVQRAHTLYTLGSIAYQQGRFNESLEYDLKALRLYEQYGQKKRAAESLGNIGAVLKATGSMEALDYYRRSIALEQEIYTNDLKNKTFRSSIARSYYNMAAVYAYYNNYDSTMFYFKKAFSFLDKDKLTLELALLYSGMAQASKMAGNYKEAITYNQKAAGICEEIHSPDCMSSVHSGFADIYLESGDYGMALHYANIAEDINRTHGFTDELLYIYETKALIYEGLKDNKNQILFLKKHEELKDSLLQKNHTLQLEELRTQYETEKKEKKIAQLSNENKIKALQLEKESETRKRLLYTIAGALLLSVFLFWIIRERKKAYLKLEEKNREIRQQGEQLSEQARLISKYQSQMNPHFVFNALNSLQGTVIDGEKEKTISRLQQFSQLMRQTLNNSESGYIGLDKEILYLKTYVSFEQERFANKLEFTVQVPAESEELMIPPMLLQPFIENAIKHAGLRETDHPAIGLLIAFEGELLKIRISDNGKGFDTSDGELIKNSHALAIARSRMKLIFKENEREFKEEYFTIRSKPELQNGTVVTFYLPLKYRY